MIRWQDGVCDRYNGMGFAVRAIRGNQCKQIRNPQAINELHDLRDEEFGREITVHHYGIPLASSTPDVADHNR